MPVKKMKKVSVLTVAALLGSVGLSAAQAADAGFVPKSAGDFVVRARGIYVAPDESSSLSVAGGDVSVSNETVPEVDFSYFLTDNIALELIAATNRHEVNGAGTLSGTSLGKVSLLPPTLTLQYHLMPKQRFSPYVGAGLNYTFFYNEDAPGGGITSVNYENNVGYALQAGVDYAISGPWSVNVDVKKIFLSTDVSVNGGAVTGEVDLDPWIVGVGIGYRF
ncbi:MAG: OmpW family protein [Parvibaculum sp.]|nr:OmpW family protein [Parvibaculum sp.]